MSELVGIGGISTASFGVGKHLNGQITSTKPFNSVTKLASLQIKSLATPSTSSAAVAVASIEIQLKGNWAGTALARFATGMTVSISSEYAKVVAKPRSSGGNDGKSIYRVEFEGGIKGIVHTPAGNRESFEYINPAAARKVVNQPTKRSSAERMDLDVDVGASTTTIATKAKVSVEEKKTSTTVNRAIAAEPARKRSASTSGVAVEPTKKREVEEAVVANPAGQKMDKDAKKEAQKLAQEKAKAIAQEKKPDGWPSHLSIAAVSTRGAGVGYSDCSSFTTAATFDFIGVVTLVVKAPSLVDETKSGEWSSILRLVDPSAPEGFDLLFELKRPGTEQLHLPNPKVGDVIVFRKIKYSMHKLYGPKITGFPTQFSHLIFPSDLLLDQSSSIQLSVVSRDKRVAGYNEADLDYARYLAKWANGKDLEKRAKELAQVVRAPVLKVGGARRGRQTVTIAEMEEKYYNLVAEVVGCHHVYSNNVLQLSVTDYSINEELYAFDEGQAAAHEIFGKRLLTINCWDDIAGNAEQIARFTEKGRIYRFDNLRIVRSSLGFLEGNLSTRLNGEQRVAPITQVATVSPEFRARRVAYFAEREAGVVDEAVKLAPVFDAPKAVAPAEVVPVVATPVEVAAPIVPIIPNKNIIAKNFGVRCDHLARPLGKTIDILKNKVDGCCYRIRARMIAHTPIEEWVQAICPDCLETIPSGFIHCEIHRKVKYVFRASLVFLDSESYPEVPNEFNYVDVLINEYTSHLVIPGLIPDEEMRRGEGRQFADLKSRFPVYQVLNKTGERARHGLFFDMAIQAVKTDAGTWKYVFVGTSFVGV